MIRGFDAAVVNMEVGEILDIHLSLIHIFYKNVHFITKAVYPVSFVVTPDGLTNVVVKVNGQEVTGSVSLEAGTYQMCIRDR